MISKMYPMKFTPIYKERIWGGNMINENLNRTLPAANDPIGESWELVDRDDEQSVIANGEFANHTITELLKQYKAQILGPKGQKYDRFPLLIKLIDAGDRLSLQVHPDENTCAEIGNGAEPKTEMWYIMGATPEGKILAGLNPKATKMQLIDLLNQSEVENMLQIYDSKIGDGYFITSGTMHAIGGGNLILEIQQNSDTTYRISDWGRVDKDGKPRQLHVELGVKSVNFINRTSPKITGASDNSNFNRHYPYVKSCPFFDIEALHLVEPWNDNTNNSMSFHLISATNTKILISNTANIQVELSRGETALIPYAFGAYTITPTITDGEKSIVLKTTL